MAPIEMIHLPHLPSRAERTPRTTKQHHAQGAQSRHRNANRDPLPLKPVEGTFACLVGNACNPILLDNMPDLTVAYKDYAKLAVDAKHWFNQFSAMDEKNAEVSKKLHAAELEVCSLQAEVEKSKDELRKRLDLAKEKYAWESSRAKQTIAEVTGLLRKIVDLAEENKARALREADKVAGLTVQLESTKMLLAEERRERAKLLEEQKTQVTDKPATQAKEKRESGGRSSDCTIPGLVGEMLAKFDSHSGDKEKPVLCTPLRVHGNTNSLNALDDGDKTGEGSKKSNKRELVGSNKTKPSLSNLRSNADQAMSAPCSKLGSDSSSTIVNSIIDPRTDTVLVKTPKNGLKHHGRAAVDHAWVNSTHMQLKEVELGVTNMTMGMSKLEQRGVRIHQLGEHSLKSGAAVPITPRKAQKSKNPDDKQRVVAQTPSNTWPPLEVNETINMMKMWQLLPSWTQILALFFLFMLLREMLTGGCCCKVGI
ncbi:hypothetical protein K470DRAFT_284814 [Piedraia hortae CBS 480.64]|uniref:Uncharacterized protein n=1 Tax=Piedraia hortae CBS 480.64 TaxID=1314780 RepID=A0A6A7C362_9PEZI|nr:hypothetical protein K470DRAFT_284814 [Piedraia hortae CBS 480.64]